MATYQFGPQQGEIDGRVDEVWAGRPGTTPPNRLAHQLLEQRLAVFSADRRKMLEDLICRGDGVDPLRIFLDTKQGRILPHLSSPG